MSSPSFLSIICSIIGVLHVFASTIWSIIQNRRVIAIYIYCIQILEGRCRLILSGVTPKVGPYKLQLAFCQRLETKGINAYYPCCWTRTKTYMERIEVVDSPKSSKTGKQHNHSQISTVGNWKSCFLPHHFAISKHSLGDFPFPTVEFFFGRGPPPVVFVCIHLALKPPSP